MENEKQTWVNKNFLPNLYGTTPVLSTVSYKQRSKLIAVLNELIALLK
jgi:hypothetical protein